jgi:NAD(P)H-flavin reductase
MRDRCAWGEPVVVMGPTGAPTEIPKNEKVLLAGGGLGNAVLFSIGEGAARGGCEGDVLRGLQATPRTSSSMDDIEAAPTR